MKRRRLLRRPEAYLRILKIIKMRPARKSNVNIAYLTTDHLRKIHEVLSNDKYRPGTGI